MRLGSRLTGWLRSVEEAEVPPDGVVTLPLDGDQYVANVVIAECRAEGLRVELVTDHIVNHPVSALQTFQLLVFAKDLGQVRAIAAKQRRPEAS
jgi:hypothetical protein